jgi:photosystem II stability/assembly factor-like uncharacterized protein
MPRLLFIVLLSVAGFTQASGQVNVWIPRGPEGGRIGRPVIDPQNPGTIYASAGGRLYRTTEAAGHWNDLGVPSVTILAVDPRNSSTLYGANNTTLYKSTDGGLTWSKPGPGLPGTCGPFPFSFVIDPSNTSTLYAGCQGTNLNGGGGLFKSTDGGATWNAASSGLPALRPSPNEPWPPNVSVHALAIDPVHGRRQGEAARPPTLTRPGTLYAAIGGAGLFRSTDGAASWNAVNSGLPDSLYVYAVAVDPQNPNTLYVAGDYGIFRSTDGGASWTRVGHESDVWSLAIDPLDSGSVYVIDDRGILKSTDGGGSWSVVSPEGTASDPFPWLVGWLVVAPGEGGPSTVYAGGNARGVFKSLDGGATWTLATSGLFATSIDSLVIDPQNPHTVYAGIYVAGLSGLYRSTDGAVSWSATPILPGVSVYALANDPPEPGTFYAGGQNGLYKSIDGGASWVQLQVAAGFADLANPIFPLAVDTRNPGTVYSGGFKSTDGGASWAKLAVGPTALAIDPQDSGTLYAGTIAGELATSVLSVSGGVRKSVDGGRSWSGVNTVSQSYGISSLTGDPTNSSVVYAQTTWLDCSMSYDCNSDYGDPNSDETKKGLGLFRSTDGGATWAKLDLPGDPFQFNLLGVDPQGTLYAWATAGLVRSMDGGATWNALPTAGLSSGVSVLAFDPQNPNHLFAGTGGGGMFEITLEQNE